jgi:hypothetical protein
MTTNTTSPDLGDLVVVLLAGMLAGLRDRLQDDGFPQASELVADLTQQKPMAPTDEFCTRARSESRRPTE